MQAYEGEAPLELLVIPESGRLEAVCLQAQSLPNFRRFRDDVTVFPHSMEWTMAFTHEESLGLGPYFSRREWM